MRQLLRVVVASVLLGVIALPAPAAETAEQCLSALNGYRKTAGLDRASATSIAALGRAAANHAAYRFASTPATPTCSRPWACPTWACSAPT